MAVADSHTDEHHGDDHHPEFIAHHFDNAEQQFDSGKLGIWVFLVTEILFFSGLFVAYVLVRSHHPLIFEQAHVFLDKWLGGLNTVVLLFSSLTMALGVRAAQLGKNKQVAIYTLITMVCAAVFIGVKAIEYSHKWDQGILVRSAFDYHAGHPEPTTSIGKSLGVSDYLVYLSVVPSILLVGFIVAAGVCMGIGKKTLGAFMACLAITVGGYFLGAVGGHVYMVATGGGVGGKHASKAMLLYAQEVAEQEHATEEHVEGGDHASGEHDSDEHDKDSHSHDEKTGHDGDHGESHEGGDHAHAKGDHAHAKGDHSHAEDDHAHADGEHGHGSDHSHGPDPTKFHRDVGIFFSIYYCMTGLHAIHIIGGIIALAWILWRSLVGHWRPDYFGPVDYVGLYWHLVDLIWIYLFPMLYLID